MIEAKKSITMSEIMAVKQAMPIHGTVDSLCSYGYWEDKRCVGGAFLHTTFPHDLVMEFYTHCPTIVKAIGQSYAGMFQVRSKLTARIDILNFKSLKMVKLLGFRRLYIDQGQVTVELTPENWRYKLRYPLNDSKYQTL